MMTSELAIWIIAACATLGVIVRPFNWPEAIWACAGAVLLVASGLIAPSVAVSGIAKGTDVYLFLIGMMLLAEVAREEGLFDWLAAHAVQRAQGSASRLFLLVYGVGTIVTIFLSNDATAVVLTPAVAAAVRTAKAADPLPFLFICAFIANAASFVLPISNPANLVIYGTHMPPLLEWLPRYALASLVAIAGTFLVLRWTQRKALDQRIETHVPAPDLSRGAIAAACGIGATAVALMVASALDLQLGLPTCLAGLATTLLVAALTRTSPWPAIRQMSWLVLPLVAGLFVLVEALGQTGVIAKLAALLGTEATSSQTATAWGSGLLVAIASNLANNLPVGLIAGSAVAAAHVPDRVTGAILIGVDLGPNLSVTGSLATILWLTALRRDKLDVGAWTFLRLGLVVMPPVLVLTLAALFVPTH
jgi:arsenical pump membrane protein